MQPMHTAYAGAAMELAKLFLLHVGAIPIDSLDGPTFSATLTEPHGPSTGGGAQSRQHITLQRGHGQRTFTIGSVDPVERTVELRGYASLSQLYQQRWNQPMPIAPEEIEGLHKRIRSFAQKNQFAVVIKEVEPAAPAEAPTGGKWNVIAFALVAIVIAVVVVLVLI